MTPLSPEQVASLRQLQTVCDRLGAELVIIGAIALQIGLADWSRHTEDVDVVIAIDLDDFPQLTSLLVGQFGADIADLVMETTDDKTLPKQERKWLQIVHAPKLSVRAQVIKLADKISNLGAILSSPPVDWSVQRRREYFDWAKEVINGLTEPNPVLKAEFDRLYERAGSLGSG